MKIKYIVEIGWEEYHFDNPDAAMAFAIVAKTHKKDNEGNQNVKVAVEVDEE